MVLESRSRLRLLLEGAAIVISILLAFAIEAGWAELQERREEQEILGGLHQEFLGNREQLSQAQATHRSRADAYAWFRNARPATIRAISTDSVDLIYGGLWAPHTFDAARSMIDALIGAGRFGVIQDRGLRDHLTSFLNRVDDLTEESERMQSSSAAVLEAMVAHGGPWRDVGGPAEALSRLPQASASDLATLRADPVFLGQIGLAHQYSADYLHELNGLASGVAAVLDRLETAIR